MTTPNTYKNGEKAVLGAVTIVCRIVKHFGPKLIALIQNQQAAGKLTADQANTAITFLTVADTTCALWALIVANAGE